LNADSIGVDPGVGVGPGDYLQVDYSMDKCLSGEDASPEYCSSLVTFFFYGES